MAKLKNHIISAIGIIGVVVCIVLFIRTPSFPTPDKILVFLTFIFMVFNQAIDMLKRFIPFIFILLAYDSFRGLVPSLNNRVHYTLMPNFDKMVFGTLPTITLQKWLWHGSVTWYDYAFYVFYMLHFILPLSLAVAIYKLKGKDYWRFALSYIIASFSAFAVFLLYPTAPPWLASQNGYIPHITRISSAVYASMGIKNFPSIYNKFAPNPVAAVPSMHAAFSVLFVIFTFKLFGKKWGTVSLIYPFMIMVGVVYMGEHYVFDVITGTLVAILSYVLAPKLLGLMQPYSDKIKLAATATFAKATAFVKI